MFFKNSSTKSTVEVLQECIPKIIISKEAVIKMKLFIEGCDDEIGWLGTAHQNKGTIYISDVMLFEQEVHSTTTEINADILSEFGEKLLSTPNGIDVWNSIKVWGHSHVNMGTYPSGQDDSQMVIFKDSGHDWFIRIIGNKKGDIKIDIYNYEQGIIYKDVPWNISMTKEEEELYSILEQIKLKLEKYDEEIEESFKENIEKEIKEKVSKKGYGSVGTYYNYNTKKYEEIRVIGENDEKEAVTKSKKKERKRSEKDIKMDNIRDGMYDDYIAEEIASALSIEEVRQILVSWGFEGIYEVYSDSEIQEIWHICSKIALEKANEEYFGGWIE